MKKYYALLLLSFQVMVLVAQSTFSLTVNQAVIGDTLQLTYRLKSLNTAEGIKIGSSDLVIKVNGNDLATEKATLIEKIDLGTGYEPIELGASKEMLGLYIRLNHQIKYPANISIKDTILAKVFIPIINRCGVNEVNILNDAGSVNQFTTTPYSFEYLKTSYLGINEDKQPLDGGFSTLTPILKYENDKIIASTNKNNSWYLNGVKLLGVTGSVIEPTELGEYSVESNNECTSIFSKPLALRVNIVEKTNDNHFDFQITPNPFGYQVRLHFNLVETSHVKLEVFDILGVRKAEIINDFYPSGKHEFLWSTTKYNLNPGHYFFRLTANGKSTTIKAIYTEQ